MDHGSDQLPSSQHPNFVNLSAQTQNQFTSISPQFHPSYQFNTMSGSCPPYTTLPYGTPFPFQNLLNTPIAPSGATETQTVSGTGRKKKKGVNKSSNDTESATAKRDFSSEEDIALTNAWLHISMDADVGNNQKLTAMWERISQVWKDNLGENYKKARSSNSLQCRWQKIQQAVNKFHGIYEKLERHPQSGSNAEDMKKKALGMYERLLSDKKKKEFKYIHCWELLIKNAKWCTSQLTKSCGPDKESLGNKNTPVENDTTPNTKNQSMEPEELRADEIVRPLGRKSSKERKRKLNAEHGVIDTLNKLQCTLEKQIQFNMAELELKKETQHKEYEFREQVMKKELELKENNQKLKAESQLMKREESERRERAQIRSDQERILSLDLSRLSPNVRATYEILQAQILKEWGLSSISRI
ncbi:unnamed protein product [Cuscuta epithymum]|nr:unnamed protein product [Cuscuta epithymum]